MAEMEFYQDDSDENAEDGYGYDGGAGVEDLTPLQRLERYLDSDNIYNRQMLARGLLDTLRAVAESEEDDMAVLDAMAKLSEDPEHAVRSELMEQIPHIAVYCQENRYAFFNAVPQYILPMVVRYLNDATSQVRKTSQAALLVLLEQELVEKSDVEIQVVQVILELAAPESPDDYRTEAAALMSKMAPLLGKDMTERLFLPKFSEMCTDPLFHVRKVCAANFGEMASVVGVKNSEDILLPKFYYLCEDGVWGVRKACAECFMTVSCACSLETRRHELANLFVNLLCDQSRWVRMSAFQQLGPFISTFADSDETGFYVNEEGNLSCLSLESYPLEQSDGSTSGTSYSEESNLQGILQLKSLDTPNIPSITQDQVLPESDHVSSPNEHVNEAMELENPEEEVNMPNTKLVFQEKSLEELRAESLNESLSIQRTHGGGDCPISQSPLGNSDNSDLSASSAAPTTICDTSASPKAHSDGLEVTTGDTQVNDNTCNNQSHTERDLTGHSMEPRKLAGQDSLSDSDSVFMDNFRDSNTATDLQVSNLELSPEKMHVHVDNTFNNFQYWRSPLPEVKIDFDLINGKPTNIHVVAKVKDDDTRKVYASEMNVSISKDPSEASSLSDSIGQLDLGTNSSFFCSNFTSEDERSGVRIHTASVSTVSDAADETVSNIGSTHVLGQHFGEQHLAVVDGIVQDLSGNGISLIDMGPSLLDIGPDDATLAQQQNIVPQLLLENYLGMINPSRAQTVDGEITRHCAYNLPAVAYTLGRKNWPCIKHLYETLAQDMQWKVRRTLAFSMHELAMIVGDEITHNDLVPVFDGFLKDLDEVRIGVLKHLADIFKILRPDVRLLYLSRVQDFMKTDNTRNWRFRQELAEQLIPICELFYCIEIVNHIVPLAIVLCMDKVAEVRSMALRLMSSILRRAHADDEKKLLASICNDIIEKFADHHRWLCRQIFAQLAYVILEEDSLPPEVFARNLLPSLLGLYEDPVANVRLSLARVLAQRVIPLEYFSSQSNPHHSDLVHTLQRLQSDADKDVRFFSCQSTDTDVPHEMVPV